MRKCWCNPPPHPIPPHPQKKWRECSITSNVGGLIIEIWGWGDVGWGVKATFQPTVESFMLFFKMKYLTYTIFLLKLPPISLIDASLINLSIILITSGVLSRYLCMYIHVTTTNFCSSFHHPFQDNYMAFKNLLVPFTHGCTLNSGLPRPVITGGSTERGYRMQVNFHNAN